MDRIDLDEYANDFVRKVTSEASNNANTFCERVKEVDQACNAPLLLTGAIGLGGEAGEFEEIVKKIFFHGKDLDDATKAHLIKELGDIGWYWANSCRSLSVLPTEVLQLNVDKLSTRYPGGEFNKYFSENRKEGDI